MPARRSHAGIGGLRAPTGRPAVPLHPTRQPAASHRAGTCSGRPLQCSVSEGRRPLLADRRGPASRGRAVASELGGQALPCSRQIWFFLVLRALAGSQAHWWISARGAVETSETSTHLPLWTATSW